MIGCILGLGFSSSIKTKCVNVISNDLLIAHREWHEQVNKNWRFLLAKARVKQKNVFRLHAELTNKWLKSKNWRYEMRVVKMLSRIDYRIVTCSNLPEHAESTKHIPIYIRSFPTQVFVLSDNEWVIIVNLVLTCNGSAIIYNVSINLDNSINYYLIY